LIKREDHEYRRSVLRVLLIITTFSAVFFAIANWNVAFYTLASIEVIVAVFWFGILINIKNIQNLKRWTLAYLLTFYAAVLYGMSVASFNSGLFVWLFIFPILSYLLLGLRMGTILTAITVFFGLGLLAWRVWQLERQIHAIFLANISFCIAAIWSMAYVYESKRETVVGRLREQVKKDPLTGLLNVRDLQETVSFLLREATLRSEPLTIAYIDIDNFKNINDTLGHQKGNEIILGVAQAIQKITRQEDISFRYGGDEFCIIFLNCTRNQAQKSYGQRLSDEVHKNLNQLSLSIGYAQTGPHKYISADDLLHEADQHMYTVKTTFKQK
jgi:diguanylate cyclase (GGDEF)-like protein